MKKIEKIFFELIRAAIGTADSLSHIPSNKEWKALYDMAMKQSLVGVCFAALQRLGADADDGFARIGMSEMLYLTWMGMTAKIQQKNQTVDEECVALQRRLSADGLRSCILKGQGVGQIYAEHLRGLRQSGDIDLFVDCGRKRVLEYLRGLGMINLEWDYVHTCPKFYDDTEVELHYRVSVTRNLWTNYRLQTFFERNKDEFFRGNVELPSGSIVVPSNWMNLFYLMQHMYRHMFTEGFGLRQVMDFYFALKELVLTDCEREKLVYAVRQFGMGRFASGLMWVLCSVFGMDMVSAPWAPNQGEGEFLLNEMMQSGNMGKMDSRYMNDSESKFGKVSSALRRSMHLTMHYPSEALAAPFYYARHFVWKRIALLVDK